MNPDCTRIGQGAIDRNCKKAPQNCRYFETGEKPKKFSHIGPLNLCTMNVDFKFHDNQSRFVALTFRRNAKRFSKVRPRFPRSVKLLNI